MLCSGCKLAPLNVCANIHMISWELAQKEGVKVYGTYLGDCYNTLDLSGGTFPHPLILWAQSHGPVCQAEEPGCV